MEEKENTNNVVKALNKMFGKTIIQPASQMKGLEIERTLTGIIPLDIEMGGGLPRGRMVEIYGPESSAKTYICLCSVANEQKLFKKPCLWIDQEGVFDPVWSQKVGVNLDLLDIAKPETAEQAGTILDSATRSGDYAIIVLDSVAAMLPEEDLDKSMDDAERIGNRAMVNNRIVRKLQSALNTREDDSIPNGTIVLFINQIRMKIGQYGNPEDTPGGKGIRFMASIRLELRRGDLIKEKEEGEDIVTAVTIKFKTVKNKTFTPFRTGQFILNTLGDKAGTIDISESIIRYAILSGVIKHEGHSYYIGDDKVLGIENLKQYLNEKPELISKLYEEVKKVYK